MGFSVDTFYRYKAAVEEGGIENLLDKSRNQPNLRNRVDESIEKRVIAIAEENPVQGQQRVANALRKEGLMISPAGVRWVRMRHQLQTFSLRLRALEKKVAEEGLVLTERQLAALEKKKERDQLHGQIETAHPGYLGT